MEKVAKRRGRPPKAEADVKRRNLTYSTTQATRDRLADAGAKVGRSLSAEIEYRIQMSLALEDDVGSASVRRLVDFVRLAAAKIEADNSGPWTDRPAAAIALHGAIRTFIDMNRGSFDEAGENVLHELGREHFLATENLANAALDENELEKAKANRKEVAARFWPVYNNHHDVVSKAERAGSNATAELAELFRLKK